MSVAHLGPNHMKVISCETFSWLHKWFHKQQLHAIEDSLRKKKKERKVFTSSYPHTVVLSIYHRSMTITMLQLHDLKPSCFLWGVRVAQTNESRGGRGILLLHWKVRAFQHERRKKKNKQSSQSWCSLPAIGRGGWGRGRRSWVHLICYF